MTTKKQPGQAGPQNNSQNNSTMLDEILDHLDRVEKTKEGYTALCPFHDDHNPSLVVFTEKPYYPGFYCRAAGCNARGGLRQLAQRLGIVKGEEEKHIGKYKDYIQERLQIPDDLFYQKIRQLNIHADQEYIKLPLIMPPDQFLGYIRRNPSEKKNINPSGQIKGVLYGLDLSLSLYNTLMIEKKAKKEITSNIFLVEGPWDALAFLAQGIPAAAILGSANNDLKLVYKTLLSQGISHVVLAFDNDKDGHKFTENYMNYFVKQPYIKTDVLLLDVYNDPNDVLRKEGPEGFKKFIKSRLCEEVTDAFISLHDIKARIEQGNPARHVAIVETARFYWSIHPVHRINIDLNKLQEDLGLTDEELESLFKDPAEFRDKERVKNELSRAISTFKNKLELDPLGAYQTFKEKADRAIQGLEKRTPVSVDDELDDIVQEIQTEKEGVNLLPQLPDVFVRADDLVTIGGKSGVGKTTIALNITHNFITASRRVLFVSYEVGRGQLLAKLLGIARGEHYKDIKKKIKAGTLDINRSLLKPLSLIADPTFTIEELTRLVGKYQKVKPLDLIVVDYDQLCSTEKIFEIEERRVAYISQTLKGIALENGVPVVLLSQLSKENRLRYSQQKLFDSSIVLKLRVPKEYDEDSKDYKEEIAKDYWNGSTRELKLDVEKYRDGQPRRDIDLTINFKTGCIDPVNL
jgi:DNA primase